MNKYQFKVKTINDNTLQAELLVQQTVDGWTETKEYTGAKALVPDIII